jgi:hypothetical protein
MSSPLFIANNHKLISLHSHDIDSSFTVSDL